VLHELAIDDYAVVDRLRVRFHAGLNLLTGETGSGKSIVVDALGLLLGGRASADMIRSGRERARVSGVFEIGPTGRKVLEQAGFDGEDSELLLDREIQSNGKSRAYVNNRPAAVALLKELAPHLGDIHGQHDQQLLFEAAAQLTMLDAFAQTGAQRAKVREAFTAWKRVTGEIGELEGADREKLRMLDLWQFQQNEIEGADLRADEDVELDAERRVQQNAGRLLDTAAASFESLYESPESALSLVRAAAKKFDELAKIDEQMAGMRQAMEPALIAIQDVAYSLRDYLGRVEANPARLEEIEVRLEAIDKLKRKYGKSVEEILAFHDDVARKIVEVEHAGERLEELKCEQKKLAAQYEQAAVELSARRKAGALDLARRVEQELKPLGMDRTVFRIQLDPASWSESGTDEAQFLVSANAGEDPRAMERVASGGELSRIALALKTCLAGSASGAVASGVIASGVVTTGPEATVRTLVFDEIDTGIGGGAAEGVARRLKTLAAQNQVVCVTHLAQIACFADYHYRVTKVERAGRTVVEIEELDAAASTEEIGRMLSGQKLTQEALRNAAELQRAARA
jgi:DNA repair protein RecN (Recombination protein N)